ncbi:MAG TPA: hypothetical protein PLG57_08150 [Bacteroidia bacterium]|jgi:hypothetical protein|nr:hypothetical protein [Bacteroidia bacterium]HQK97771.1 hypothetical protein [Bacteroidia bacterium]
MKNTTYNSNKSAGILGMSAPELRIGTWIDHSGCPMDPPSFIQLLGKTKVIFCYQPNCRGSIGIGLPIMKKLIEVTSNNPDVEVMAVQTIFNFPYDHPPHKLPTIQKELQMPIPIGYTNHRTNEEACHFISDYNVVGTPWYIFIDANNKVIYNHYYITLDEAMKIIRQ